MYSIPEQVSALNKAGVEAFIGFAGLAASSTQRFVDFQLQTAKTVFAESVAQARAIAEVKDPQELVKLGTVATQPAAEKATSYAQHVFSLATQSHAELNAFVEKQIAETNKALASLIDETAKHAPAGSESVVAAARSVVSTANQAYDVVSKVTKQVTEATEATLQSVAKAGLQAANTATGKKKAA